VIAGNARSARFSVKTVGERLAQRVYASTRTCASFEDDYLVTEFGELITSNKPGHSSAQDEHLFGRAGYRDCRDSA
jgi:hypothetical protein